MKKQIENIFFQKNFEKKFQNNFFQKKIFQKKISLEIIFFISIFFSCKKSTSNLPIDENKMELILVDINKVEGALDAENVFVKDTLGKKYYNQVFEKHHVTKQDFDSTMSLLEHDPERLLKLYKHIVKEIDPMESKEIKK